MSRKIIYTKEMLTSLWEEYNKSGHKKLKEFCKIKSLKYISIYTAFRKNGIMTFLKKGQKKVEVVKEKEPVVTV